MKLLPILITCTCMLTLVSCDKEQDPIYSNLYYNEVYTSPDFQENAASVLDLQSKITALKTLSNSIRTQGVLVQQSELFNLYELGNPSILDQTSQAFTDLMVGNAGSFQAIQDASSGGVFSPGNTQNQGGYFEGRVFDEYGVEPYEFIDKGLYGAAMYYQANRLLKSDMTLADLDRAIALFGANPSFPNSGSSLVQQPDLYLANYAARRDKNDGKGLYTQMKSHFLYLQAALVGGQAYHNDRDLAISTLKATWERANAATVINYCHSAISKLSLTNPSTADLASALHAYSEGIGFLTGWRSLPENYRTATNEQLDAILVQMLAPYGQTPSGYLFATDPVNQLPRLQTAISLLQSTYGFTAQDIDDFKHNWVAEQGR